MKEFSIISITLCSVNCLLVCFFFAGKVQICFDLIFHGQLCNWMTGLEADLNTLRKQFEPKLMLVPNGFARVLVLCMLVFFGSDLRYVI